MTPTVRPWPSEGPYFLVQTRDPAHPEAGVSECVVESVADGVETVVFWRERGYEARLITILTQGIY